VKDPDVVDDDRHTTRKPCQWHAHGQNPREVDIRSVDLAGACPGVRVAHPFPSENVDASGDEDGAHHPDEREVGNLVKRPGRGVQRGQHGRH